jgi:hypothetical protein
MPNTYTIIGTSTASNTTTGTLQFTSIPQTYTDLWVHITTRGSGSGSGWEGVFLAFNSTSRTTSHVSQRMYGFSSTITGDTSLPAGGSMPMLSHGNSSSFSTYTYQIPNYTDGRWKTAIISGTEGANSTNTLTMANGQVWQNTAAITSIQITPESSTYFAQGSEATLYGIKNS